MENTDPQLGAPRSVDFDHDHRSTSHSPRVLQPRVVLRFLFICLLVGFILSSFGFTPENVLSRVERLITGILDMGVDAVWAALDFILLGAVVVLPVWILRATIWK